MSLNTLCGVQRSLKYKIKLDETHCPGINDFSTFQRFVSPIALVSETEFVRVLFGSFIKEGVFLNEPLDSVDHSTLLHQGTASETAALAEFLTLRPESAVSVPKIASAYIKVLLENGVSAPSCFVSRSLRFAVHELSPRRALPQTYRQHHSRSLFSWNSAAISLIVSEKAALCVCALIACFVAGSAERGNC